MGYIKRGAFRYVCVNPLEEKEFVTDYFACIYQVASEISIQAITPCEVYICNIEEILQMFNENMDTQIQARNNAERILFCVYQNYIDLYRKTPEERSYKFILAGINRVATTLAHGDVFLGLFPLMSLFSFFWSLFYFSSSFLSKAASYIKAQQPSSLFRLQL